MQRKYLPASFLMSLLISVSSTIAAAPIVKIFSYEEALTSQNTSKPRIYIQNLAGSVPISNFYYYYYFTTEDNKSPVLEDYYTPNSIPILESLGNSKYRVKFTFLGVTLQPGQILPNTSGEVIGIRYTDWSPLDKTNDHSNNLGCTFVLNPNVPVFLANGTQIYGNLPPDPANPPQPPTVYSSAGDFAVFSEEYTDLRDRVKITAGNIGSSAYTEMGCDDTLYGNVLSKGTVFLRERARIYGDVTSGQVVNEQNDVYIQGANRNYAQMELPVLQTPNVTYGTTNVSVPPNSSYTLTPGLYCSFHAYANVSLSIQPGEYSFREFILEPNVIVNLNIANGDYIDIKVEDNCRLGNGTNMILPTGINTPYVFSIHSAQTSELYVGTDAIINGLIFAPDAEVHVYSRTEITGSLYGKRVVVEPDVQLCKPPTLLGLSHSEGAMAPPFDPMVFNYLAVVPDITSTVTVTPQVMPGQAVTVNGNTPETPVDLVGAETDIIIEVSDAGVCGTTKYKLKVKRSADYQIFVNPNSTCPPGSETGLTWECGFKTVQQALDEAAKKGMEVWVKEGTYIPTVRTDPSDPRSATFVVYSGVEIKGRFAGTETEDMPIGGRTIFSGDVLGDDTNCMTWPPDTNCAQYRDDNLYHVVTVKGAPNSEDIILQGATIERGNADGTGINCSGGGMLILSGKPKMEFEDIHYNTADCSGGGIYVTSTGGISTFKNCLVDFNVSKNGDGGGMAYLSSDPLVIDASIFDQNTTNSTSVDHGGSALYFDNAHVYMINAVFVQNTSKSAKGAVLNNGATLEVFNCTFAFNTSTGAVSISNANGGSTVVKNSILWNNAAKNEVSDTNFTITFTCITNGHTGANNISVDPEFLDYLKPAGEDGRWGSFDDGIRLAETSPCRDRIWQNVPDVDIITTPRWHNYTDDMGAYEYQAFVDADDNVFGIIYNDYFLPKPITTIIDFIINKEEILVYANSTYARVLRIAVPKNKYSDGRSSGYIYLRGKDASGNYLPGSVPVKINMYRVDEDASNYYYQSRTSAGAGKEILLVNTPDFQNYSNSWAYVVYSSIDGKFEITVPYNQ